MTPCNEEVTHNVVEVAPEKWLLKAVCGCGAALGWHSLRGFSVDEAKENLWEGEHAHRLGVSYGNYIGVRDDGEPMTEEEYAPFAKLIKENL